MNENVIEWLRGQETAAVTLTQQKYINRLVSLSEKYPNECQIVRTNEDGSIFAKVPTKWIKISRPREMSDEQREKARARLSEYKSQGE